MTRSVLPAAQTALRARHLVALLLLLAACSSQKCYRMGYEKAGTSPEQGRADLAVAMQEAERRYPDPPGAVSADFMNQVLRARVQVTSAEMQRRGYTPVKMPVDCETGASLDEGP